MDPSKMQTLAGEAVSAMYASLAGAIADGLAEIPHLLPEDQFELMTQNEPEPHSYAILYALVLHILIFIDANKKDPDKSSEMVLMETVEMCRKHYGEMIAQAASGLRSYSKKEVN